MAKSKTKQIKLLFFGYPSKSINYTGGHLWMKKVADHIEKNDCYSISKISNQYFSKKGPIKIFNSLHSIIKALKEYPQIAFLDAWGESNIILWLLLRLIKPKTKIFVVFHHHEPRIIICKNFLELVYNYIVQKLIMSMLKNSDIILTVSQSSKQQLNIIYGIKENKIKNSKEKSINKNNKLSKNLKNKIAIVGTGIDINLFLKGKIIKEIDFLCIGRIEKFNGLDKIWIKIKAQRPESNLVIVGRSSEECKDGLRKIGIDHRGFVSEEEKINLYSKSKVFVFPSSREGFGIAMAEAFCANLPVVAWKIPVFEEFYLNNNIARVKLIEYENYDLFAEECLKTLDQDKEDKPGDESKKTCFHFPTWQTVAKNVMTTIDSINSS